MEVELFTIRRCCFGVVIIDDFKRLVLTVYSAVLSYTRPLKGTTPRGLVIRGQKEGIW